jgi:hypothetical protein
MNKTLLERAKSAPIDRPIKTSLDEEQLEALVISWVQREVTTTQVSRAVRRKGSAVYGLIAVALRRAFAAGRLIIK